MKNEEVYSRLTPIFRKAFEDDVLVPVPSMVAADVPTWDSLANVTMIVEVEREFGVRFPLRRVSRLQNVGQLVELILEKSN